jgi:hypothetical protein
LESQPAVIEVQLPEFVQASKDKPEPPPLDPRAAVLGELVRERIRDYDAARPRNTQRAFGFSNLGGECDRELAYQAAAVAPVHFPDPLRPLIGTWMHAGLADLFRELDHGTGRYLVEAPVAYKGIVGTCDLFDRVRRTVFDWKGTVKASRKLRAGGIPSVVNTIQVVGYALGLRAAGEAVESVALVHIPFDGALDDIRVWTSAITPELIDRTEAAIARANDLVEADPATTKPSPSALCGWCSWHRPGTADLSVACPGDKE